MFLFTLQSIDKILSILGLHKPLFEILDANLDKSLINLDVRVLLSVPVAAWHHNDRAVIISPLSTLDRSLFSNQPARVRICYSALFCSFNSLTFNIGFNMDQSLCRNINYIAHFSFIIFTD